MEADAPILGDEEVAGMWIAVEHAEYEYLVQVGVDEGLRQARPIGLDAWVVDAPPAAALLDDHGLADKPVDHAGDIDCGPIGAADPVHGKRGENEGTDIPGAAAASP